MLANKLEATSRTKILHSRENKWECGTELLPAVIYGLFQGSLWQLREETGCVAWRNGFVNNPLKNFFVCVVRRPLSELQSRNNCAGVYLWWTRRYEFAWNSAFIIVRRERQWLLREQLCQNKVSSLEWKAENRHIVQSDLMSTSCCICILTK